MRKAIVSTLVSLALAVPAGAFAAEVTCWFPPAWKSKGPQAKAIADALGAGAGVTVKPRIGSSYPEILHAFETDEPNLVYIGSFVQAIIKARGLGTPLAQAVDGNELYGSWMVFPKGQDPQALLKDFPADVAFTVGASSGESGAKAATGGKASMGVPNHDAAAGAVKAGKAKAAFVKNSWWKGNKDKFAELDVYQVPGVSDAKNPDNVLTASKAVPADLQEKLAAAALGAKDAFGAPKMAAFDAAGLDFSVDLMKKGGIDPKTYTW